MRKKKKLIGYFLLCLFINLTSINSVVKSENLELMQLPENISITFFQPGFTITRSFAVLLPDTTVNWECDLASRPGAYFQIIRNNNVIVNVDKMGGSFTDSFLAQPGQYYMRVYTGDTSAGPDKVTGNVSLTDEALYRVRCTDSSFWEDKKAGTYNFFYLYLPAYIPTQDMYNTAQGSKSKTDMNDKKTVETRNYPIRVWYKFRAGRHNSDLNIVQDNPYFRIFQYFPESGVGEDKKISHKFRSNSISGFYDIPANEGIQVTINTGSWGFWNKYGFNCWYVLTYMLDKEAPTVPENLRLGNSFLENDGKNYTNQNPVVLQWDPSIDKGTIFRGFEYGPSGVKEYELFINGTLEWIEEPEKELILNEDEYRIKVKARDFDDNASDYSEEYTLVVDRTPPVGSIVITSDSDDTIIYIDETTGKKYINSRNIDLNLDATDNLSGVAWMRFNDNDTDYTPWEAYRTTKYWTLTNEQGTKTVYVQYRDYADNISTFSDTINLDTTAPEPVNDITITSNNIYTDGEGNKYINNRDVILNLKATDNLSGVDKISLKNENDTDYGSWVNYTESQNWELSGEDGEKTVSVRYKDNVENVSSSYQASIILDTIGPEGSIEILEGEYTDNSNVTLKLRANDELSGMPYECVRFSNDDNNYSPWKPLNAITSWGLTGGEGLKTVYVQFRDNLGNTTTEHATITLDTKSPTGSFTIEGPGGKDGYTNSRNVKIRNIEVWDKGTVQSGIKGVYFWNGEEDTPPPESRYIPYESDDGTIADINWDLPEEGPEGEYIVTMQVVDNAGNASGDYPDDPDDKVIRRTITLDTKAPPTPNDDFKHFHQVRENGTKEIVFTWTCENPDEDLERFRVKIGDVADEVEPVFGDDFSYALGSFTVDTAYYGFNKPNEPVQIAVRSVDHVGNESEEAEYTAYTQAKLGELAVPNQGYLSLGDGFDHYLSWNLAGEDEDGAKGHVLEIATEEDFTDFIQASLEVNQFRVDGLTPYPNGKYYYRLVALNHSGDRTVGEKRYYEMENNPPEPFNTVSLRPVGYAPVDFKFTYDNVKDPDGHNLTYRVYWAKGEDPPEEDFKEAQGDQETGFTINLDKQDHGKTFTWYAAADDGYDNGISKSEQMQFRFDARPPEFEVEDPLWPYTNQEELVFTVSDDLSGVQGVGFKRIHRDEEGEPISDNEDELISVVLEPREEGGFCGVIPLEEGYYDLKITAWDGAGNETVAWVNEIQVDHTSPVLTNIEIALPEDSGRYLSGTGEVPLVWTAVDNSSGIKGLRYWFLTQPGEELGEGKFIQVIDPYSGEAYLHNLGIPGQTGDEYYLAAMIEDRAGNVSEVFFLNQPVLVDRTPPKVGLDLSGCSFYGGAYYLADLADLSVELNAEEDFTEIVAEQKAIILTTGEFVTDWKNKWEDLLTTELAAGGRYRVAGRAENAAGLETVVQSGEFIFDNKAPVNLTLTLTAPGHDPAPGETILFEIGAEDNESVITAYRLAIGTSPGETQLTKEIPGNGDGWLVIPPGRVKDPVRLVVPEIPDGVYYPLLEVVNAAGLSSSLEAEPFTVVRRPMMQVNDEGPYTMYGDRLSGHWRYTGSEEVEYYQYRIVGPMEQTIYGWEKTDDTETTVDNLELENGARYVFEVQAILAAGEKITGKSSGVVVDTSPPEITVFETGAYATSVNLRFTWDGKDEESGITSVQAALGSDYYGTDITGGWVEINGDSPLLSCDVKGNRLQLETGTSCYITLRVINGAELMTELTSTAVVIDDTPPPEPLVFDQGKFINVEEDQSMEARWFWTEPDPESGTVKYEWTVVTGRDELTSAEWRDGDETMTASLSMAEFTRKDGETYYFAVKAFNGAGLSSIGWSDGITVDTTAPYIRRVKLLQAVEDREDEVNYITHTEGLKLWIDALDPDSGEESYGYAWGTREELDQKPLVEAETSVIELVDFQMPDEEGVLLFFLGACQNPAGLTGIGYSAGVMMETGAPTITNVRGALSGGRFLFDWDVDLSNSVSPVDYYEVALVPVNDLNTTPPANWEWEKINERRYERQIEDIPEGGYHLVIRGYNKAGIASRQHLGEWGVSELVVIDYTPPEIHALDHDNYVSHALKAEVRAEDNLSGIRAYQYALGSFSDLQAYTGRWVDLDNRDERITFEVPIDRESIPHGSELYLTVRAQDGAGLWSNAERSDKILVDHTPPAILEITCGPYTTSKEMIEGIEYISEDPESGITHYRLSLVTKKGGEWLTDPEPQLVEDFTGLLDNLSLEEEGKYYLVMITRNAAGLWSDPEYSGPIIVDTTPPVLEFYREDETNGEIVVNLDDLPLELEYWLSEDAQVNFDLVFPDEKFMDFEAEGVYGDNTLEFDQEEYGVYLLSARATDPAGNRGEKDELTIRVNTPPQISLVERIDATPGQLLQLSEYANVTDSDGDPVLYICHPQWTEDDEGVQLTEDKLKNLEFSYTEPGDYTLRLNVIDNDGGISSAYTVVQVRNTTQGTLYMNETWSGTHRLSGEVIVPQDITLNILPGAEIIIEGSPGIGYDYGLLVQGTLVVSGPQVIFKSVGGENGVWRGIYVEGNTDVEGLTMMHARRGLTVAAGADATVVNCVFQYNNTGVHVFNSWPLIENTTFMQNTLYGIKEDQGGRPVVINCIFNGNGYDYYHETLTDLTMEQLNELLEENDGNRRQ